MGITIYMDYLNLLIGYTDIPNNFYSPSPTMIDSERLMFSGLPPGRPCVVRQSVNNYSVTHNLRRDSGEISLKLVTNTYHTIGHCRKGFHGNRSKVKVKVKVIANHRNFSA